MSIVFKHDRDTGWSFEKFAVSLGSSLFSREFFAYTLADAVLMSKHIQDLHRKSLIDQKLNGFDGAAQPLVKM